jgi:hypothetical protein
MNDQRFDLAQWEALTTPPSSTFGETRLIAHWAAQLVAAAGTTFAPAREDFSHTNLGWVRALGALAGQPIGDRQVCAALRLSDLHLLVVEGDSILAQLELAGATMQDALAWLGGALRDVDSRLDAALGYPTHEMPKHAVGDGAPFPAADRAVLEELAPWFANAQLIAGAVANSEENAAEPRCWPHHFDLATLITLDGERTIGVGMSPGDGSYADPYFYVTPWPYPSQTEDLPRLPAGHWHTQSWVGAVLQTPDSGIIRPFLDTAIAALR